MFCLNGRGLSFFDKGTNMGVKDLGLRLCVDGVCREVSYGKVKNTAASSSAEGTCGSLKVSSCAEFVKSINAVVLEHRISNVMKHPIWVSSAKTGQFADSAAVLHGKGHGLGWDLRFCHTDNLRVERYPHCLMDYPYVRMLPVEKRILGAGEDQAFPALFIKDTGGRCGVVFAAASQNLNYTVFEMCKAPFVERSVFESFAVIHDPGQSGGFEVPAGGELKLDGVFIQLTGDVPYEDAFADYVDFIARRFKFRGPRTPLLKEAFHCTWNYGVFADQTYKSLMPTARFISKNLPNIRWFLMDAGYLHGDIGTTFLDRFYPDPNQYVVKKKWPRGIRGYTDELRKLGLRPGIWWSPTVTIPSRIYDEHPDWFMRRADGSLYLIGEKNAYLDYSNPEALAYLDRTLAVIFGEWGMDSCKMDFWSQNFEDRDIRLQNTRMTAVQARTLFFETIRRHLPKDGIFMTCVATGMGNPFIGQWADTYRNTIDIGVGKWHEQIGNCIWALPTLFIEGSKTFLLNNDSAGIMAEYPDNENQFRLTWSFMNMGMIETGGRMETWPEKWVTAMRKLTDRCDRGYRVRCPDDRALTGVPLPEVLYVDYPKASPTAKAGVRQSVALFNWTDEPRIISVPRARLGHSSPVKAENFWSGEKEDFSGEFILKKLEARSAILFDVMG